MSSIKRFINSLIKTLFDVDVTNLPFWKRTIIHSTVFSLLVIVFWLVLFCIVLKKNIGETIPLHVTVFIATEVVLSLREYFGPLLWDPEKKRIYKLFHSLSLALHDAKTSDIRDRSNKIISAVDQTMMKITSTLPEVDEMDRVDVSLYGAKKNLCAVSSKNINLWQDSTFLYYFIENAARTIDRKTEASKPPLRFVLSTQCEHGKEFSEEEQAILKSLALGEIPKQFFTLRFLLYSREEYKKHIHLVRPLIKAHCMLGMHCVPLLTDALNYLERADQLFIKKICSDLDMTGLKFPDILVVDVGATTSKEGESHPVLWYYTNVGPVDKREEALLIDSSKCIFILAALAYNFPDCWWPGHHPDSRYRLGVSKISDCADNGKCPFSVK